MSRWLPSIIILAFTVSQPAVSAPSLENQLKAEYQISIQNILRYLPQTSAQLGAVAASPSAQYQFHWTRDAALTHQALFQVYLTTNQIDLKTKILNAFQNWVQFEKRAVQNAIKNGLGAGEPKFQLDGNVFRGDWGRPQNDGPAIRSIVMSQWALYLIQNGKIEWVKKNLYGTDGSQFPLVKTDLDFVVQNWKSPSFDLWEEIKGMNFYTLSLQRKSLLIGAELAQKLDDPTSANRYLNQAALILERMTTFFDVQKNYIVAIQNQVDGWGHKTSNIDVSVILGTVQGFNDNQFLAQQAQNILLTAQQLENFFQKIYPINQNHFTPAIGRYPEDVYDGSGFSGGNPWFLTTHAHAELYCKFSRLSRTSGRTLQDKGLQFLARSLEHRDQQTGEMSEQFSRFNGYLTGVSHLTWSYASYITAYLACRGSR